MEEENGGVSSIIPDFLTGDMFFKKQGVEIGREVKKARERESERESHTHTQKGRHGANEKLVQSVSATGKGERVSRKDERRIGQLGQREREPQGFQRRRRGGGIAVQHHAAKSGSSEAVYREPLQVTDEEPTRA